ncbi:MAG: SUMF1/EgtB/PvdO family nonheme iron enzyme [Myxococcales bacterium]|nr:SUMF1/EgtB/PvdO family nonheme iron enzyme [Myxococcales bacterium]
MRNGSRVPRGARPGLVRRMVALSGTSLLFACSVDYVASDPEYQCKRDPASCSAGGGTGGTSGGNGGASGAGGVGGSSGDGGGTGGTGGGPCPAGAGPPKVLVHAPNGGPATCISATEVTYLQYKQFVDANVPVSGQIAACDWNVLYAPTEPQVDGTCNTKPFDSTGSESYPVRCVDWCDAVAYCTWAGARLCGGFGGVALAATDFAASSKSEWFAACVGDGAPKVYPYGDVYGGQTCNGADNAVNGAITVQGAPGCRGSGEGQAVFDLSGNVAEWESSCSGTRVATCRIRGGSYKADASGLRCDADRVAPRTAVFADVGFRCCASPL